MVTTNVDFSSVKSYGIHMKAIPQEKTPDIDN